MNALKVFNFNNSEVRVIEKDGQPWWVGRDVCAVLDLSDARKSVNLLDEDERNTIPVADSMGRTQETLVINEAGLYSLILRSRKSEAKQFKRWIMHDVLPSIRRTGGYVSDDDQFLETYLPFADEQTRSLFRSTLVTVRQQNELIKEQRAEIDHKENVIIGLVDDIDLATKRQVLNRVVRKAGYHKVQLRWNELYRQFELKYHMNLKRKLESYNEDHKPKLKGKLDYIDKVLDKLPVLYEIACKIYEADVKELVAELYELQETNEAEEYYRRSPY